MKLTNLPSENATSSFNQSSGWRCLVSGVESKWSAISKYFVPGATCFLLMIGIQKITDALTPVVCTTPIVLANFGVDRDHYATTPIANSDDLFYSSAYPGAGIGVIGITAATATPPISAADFRTIVSTAATAVDRNR